MSDERRAPTLEIEYRLLGRTGKAGFSCWFDGNVIHHTSIDLSASRHAEKVASFVRQVIEKLGSTVTPDDVEKVMTDRVAEAFSDLVLGNEENGKSVESQATMLVKFADELYLFRTPGADPEIYVTITCDSTRRSYAVRSMAFRRWLIGLFYERNQKAPGSQAVQDAVNTITARGLASKNVHEVHLRLATREGAIWLDLADDTGAAVEITSFGWRIVPGAEVPLPFIRRRGTLPIPMPVRGGTVDELRQFVNVGSDDDWHLLVAWLVAALRPGYPFPVLNITGEQGSAKSTTTKVVRKLIDPNRVLTRTPPRDARDLFIAAGNSWVPAFDNVSFVPDWLSDALCILATGGGFGTRELYSDDEEKLFDVMRPVMLNSIADVVERSDLVDRAVSLSLPRIEEAKRIAEEVFWSRFHNHWPGIIGALLDGVSTALRNINTVDVGPLPRMADFTRWAVAAEPALRSTPGSFLDAYRDNRAGAHEVAVETSAIGPALLDLFAATPDVWEGTASELLNALERRADDRTKRRRDWPKTPRGISGALRRLAPNLRQMGLELSFVPTGRKIVLSGLRAGNHGQHGRYGSLQQSSNPAQQVFSEDQAGIEDDDTPEVRL